MSLEDLSDESIAELMVQEMQAFKHGRFISNTYNRRHNTAINHTFLANTINLVQSHNRREEIDECWRQHKVMKLSRGLKPHKEMGKSEDTMDIDAIKREHWAAKKLENAMAESTESASNRDRGNLLTLQSTESVNVSNKPKKAKKAKKNSKHKNDKSKRKKEKKHKKK